MSKLNGKVALITGGNSGIGYATAKVLKENGATVIITGRSEERVNEASKTLGVDGYVADVTDLNAIKELAKQVEDKYSKLDILFINAGVFFGTSIGETSEEVYHTLVNTNLTGAVFTLENFASILNEKASVITLSSVVAHGGMNGAGIYAATKAALNAYTKAAAVELAPRGIRVNAVNPGPIETPIYGKIGMPQEAIDGFASAMGKRLLAGRFGTSEEVAKLVTFLASDDASYITGSEYNVDGGMSVDIMMA